MSTKRIEIDASNPKELLSPKDKELFKSAWETTRAHHDHTFTFHLPGMIRYRHERGRYPAISITGDDCELQCEHCKGKLLEPMLKAENPDRLVEISYRLARSGALGILLSGGSDHEGKLPWRRYIEAIEKIKHETTLFMSAHTGFPDHESCELMKRAGMDQALIDVMGDDETATQIYHLRGLKSVLAALEGIKKSGLELIPHIVAGLFHGKIKAEYEALRIIHDYHPAALVVVVLTPLKGTPMARVDPPSSVELGRLIAKARLLMPEIPISLGCERPRGRDGELLEKLAIHAGANRMALWSEEAIHQAKALGLSPRFQATCCSLSYKADFEFRDGKSFFE